MSKVGIPVAKQFTLGKKERLKSRKQIDALFKKGKKINISPFLVYYATEKAGPEPLQFGIGVSSKVFKKAVDRNRIKRLTREAYRLQKKGLQKKMQERQKNMTVFFIYTAKELPEYKTLYEAMGVLLEKLTTLAR